MKKQDILYKKEFETLDKKKKDRFVHEGYYGLEFADEIAMFEVIDPKAKYKYEMVCRLRLWRNKKGCKYRDGDSK